MSDDDQLTNSAIADLLGVKVDSWRSLVKTGHAPPPDGRYEGPAGRDGTDHGVRWWYRRTIVAWEATRPGRGYWGRHRRYRGSPKAQV